MNEKPTSDNFQPQSSESLETNGFEDTVELTTNFSEAPAFPEAAQQPLQTFHSDQANQASQFSQANPSSGSSATAQTHGFNSSSFEAAYATPPATKSKKSGLMVGLSMGALVGALVGGAAGSLVTANLVQPVVHNSNTAPTVISTSETSSAVSAIAQATTASVVTIEVVTPDGLGSGSGVIYTSDGYIITNAHVVTNPGTSFAQTNVRVFLSDGRILPAEIVGTAPYSDIAVLKVDGQELPAINIGNSEEIQVGDLAVAIGAPFDLSNTLTSGVVSTVYRGIAVGSALIPGDENQSQEENPWNFDFDIPGREAQTGGQVTLPVIQTDADINPGNSGGALLNGKGELIGINVAIASTGSSAERAGSVGLGFSIPVNLATRVADSIISGESVTHGLLGATVEDSRNSDVSTVRGGLVRELVAGGAAEEAGIKPGDVIVSIDGIPTPDGTTVSAMVRYFESGSEVDVEIVRGNESVTETVVLGSLT